MKVMICFQNEFGGTDLLLSRLEEWCKRHKIQVYRNDKNVKNMELDLIILPMGCFPDLISLRQKGIKFKKILIWVMGACFVSSFVNVEKLNSKNILIKSVSNILLNAAKKTLKCFFNKNSVIFTDVSAAQIDLGFINECRNIDPENLIYPVAIDEYKGKYGRVVEKSFDDNIITVGWLGRISRDFKVYSLIKVIEDFIKHGVENDTTLKIKFYIIGDGDGLEETQKYLKENNLDYNIVKHVDYADLPKTINQNIDLLFAMGTSALDGARIGCPTIVVRPMKTKDQFNSIYSWFYDMEGYSLGTLTDESKYRNFKEISNEFYPLENHSNKCREASKNFISERIFERMFNRERINRIDDIRIMGWLILLQAHFIKIARRKFAKMKEWFAN